MSTYQPPFQLTLPMINLTAIISEQIGRLDASRPKEIPVELRRANLIQALHSSLAIEGNSLTLQQATALLETPPALHPSCLDLEIRNAYQAYDQIEHINPYSLEEILRLHAVMMANLDQQAGHWRTRGEGVYRGKQLVFMAPPARLVPELMRDLFAWLQAQKTTIHPLILSSIFHYEFVFIHPFTDGNGRMARLWQSAILSRWQAVCAYLPIETMIKNHQAGYYQAINNCNRDGDASEFIEFILTMINESLQAQKIDKSIKTDNLINDSQELSRTQKLILRALELGPAKAKELSAELECSDRTIRRALMPLIASKQITASSDNPNDPGRTYSLAKPV